MSVGRGAIAIALAVLLVLTGCAGSRVAKEREARKQGTTVGTGGMVAQLNLQAESDASIGGLINYNPYAPKQQTRTWLYEPLMVQSSLDCVVTALAGHGLQVAGRQQADLRHPARRQVD